LKIKTIADEYIDVKVIDFDKSILINYNLIENSARQLLSIDRGASSDRYECTFTFRGKQSYIDLIIQTLTDLRAANLPVELTECNESFFGENIDYTLPIDCVVTNFGKSSSPNFNVFDLTVTLLADTNTLSFIGTPNLPLRLRCLQNSFEAYSDWNTTVNETYFRSAYFVDSEEDTYTFTGDYIVNNTDLQNILAFHKTIRGNNFATNDIQFGVPKMFGPTVSETSHVVVIKEITYSRMSAIVYKVTITLVRQ